MDNKKMLMSLGTAIMASKFAKSISSIELNDVLGTVGLSRRRNYFWENLGLVAAGAIVGAGAAILFAPKSGSETRRQLSSQASKFGSAALDAVREQKDEALKSLSQVANGAVGSSGSQSRSM